MPTYRELGRTPEFTSFFLVSSVQVAAATVSGLALATLVFAATGSPLLSALSMFGSSFTQVIGASLLMSAADRLPPRAATTAIAAAFAVSTALLAAPGLPVGAVFAVLLCQGLVASVGGGVRYGLLNEILPKDRYLLGRSVLNMGVGTTQICGFAVGGVLVTALSPRGTLLAGAALYAAAAALARLRLTRRPPRAEGRPSVTETWRVNSRLWASGSRRRLYLGLWVPNGLIVGCESLFVPYAPEHAGLLFAAAAVGMLAGDTVTGRFLTASWRRRLPVPLLLLLAGPYLPLALHPALPLAVAAVALASVGYAAGLLQQEQLMARTPDAMTGQALGLHSSGMLTFQGIGAAVAGTVAQRTSPGTAMALTAAASIAVTLALALMAGSGRIRGPRRPVEGGRTTPRQVSGV
ncbi:MFS transporter [Streptomyces sp. NPDC050485]|uniref:MFS transporter n=1 Tax=Streptomyces sp. NPDC050485 TaxID=3365617 RepID=UPI0037B9804D